jgi:hypothetical protein
MSRNVVGTNTSTKVYVNTISGGTGIDVVTANNSTSSTVNLKLSKLTSSQATINDTDLLLVENAAGTVSKITGEHLKAVQASNTSSITSNATNIASNTSNITGNTTNIASNTSSITSNATNIASNTSNITGNTTNIASNTSNISSNTSNIASNTSNITGNTTNIALAETAINTNETNINLKEPIITASTILTYYRGDKSFQPLTKTTIGLSNVDDTSDINKPISNPTQSAIDSKQDTLQASSNIVIDTSTTPDTIELADNLSINDAIQLKKDLTLRVDSSNNTDFNNSIYYQNTGNSRTIGLCRRYVSGNTSNGANFTIEIGNAGPNESLPVAFVVRQNGNVNIGSSQTKADKFNVEGNSNIEGNLNLTSGNLYKINSLQIDSSDILYESSTTQLLKAKIDEKQRTISFTSTCGLTMSVSNGENLKVDMTKANVETSFDDNELMLIQKTNGDLCKITKQQLISSLPTSNTYTGGENVNIDSSNEITLQSDLTTINSIKANAVMRFFIQSTIKLFIKANKITFYDDIENNLGNYTSNRQLILTDATKISTIHSAFVGAVFGGDDDFCGVRHTTLSSSNDYCLLQKNTGQTFINSKSGQTVSIRVNNADIATFSSTAITLKKAVTCDQNLTFNSNLIGNVQPYMNHYTANYFCPLTFIETDNIVPVGEGQRNIAESLRLGSSHLPCMEWNPTLNLLRLGARYGICLGLGTQVNGTFMWVGSKSSPHALTDNTNYTSGFAHRYSETDGNYYISRSNGSTTRYLVLRILRHNGQIHFYVVPSGLSDDRIKFNEKKIENALDVITKLSPETYDRLINITDKTAESFPIINPNPEDLRKESGFIAQEIEDIPELSYLVSTDDTGLKSLQYQDLISWSIAGIQELNTKNIVLENKVQDLESEVELLKLQMKRIHEKLSISYV